MRCIEYCSGPGQEHLRLAAEKIRGAKRVILSGMGASYIAGVALKDLFNKSGFHAVLEESSELMYHDVGDAGDVVLLLSRSGKSFEVLKVLELAQKKGSTVITICNDIESPLAKGSDINLWMHVDFDHSISVSTYTSILLVGLILHHTCMTVAEPSNDFFQELRTSVDKLGEWMDKLQQESALQNWVKPDSYYYFLARGEDICASLEAGLLWEEGVKMPSSVKTTGNFRHGAQEVISKELSIMLWIGESSPSYRNDLALYQDLQQLGVNILVIDDSSSDPPTNQFIRLPYDARRLKLLSGQIPAQLAAYYLAKKKGVDADTFNYCDYIVNSEGGIL